jgi:hypothetical protein
MPDTREIQGIWWFPEDASKRWIGRLTLASGKSPRLDFTLPHDAGFPAPPFPTALIGTDEHSEPVCVLRLGRNNLRSTSTIAEASYDAGHAFIGLQISDTVDIRIRSVDVYMQHLVGWVRRTGFQSSVILSPNEEGNIRYRRPSDLSFTINDRLSVEVKVQFGTWDRGREQGVRENTYLHFESKGGLEFLEIRDLVNAIRQFLHFAILKPVYPIRLMCESAPSKQLAKAKSFEWFSGWLRDYVEPELSPDRWIFQFSDVEVKFGAFLSNWLNISKTHREALDCYFITVYNRLSDSVQHLSLTQALEAYHGVANASHHRKFETKICELAEAHCLSLPRLFDDPADFALTVLHNRNYYTHHNPKWLKLGRVLKGADLFRLNEKLRILFQACMLKKLGIPAARCTRLRRQLARRIIDYY